MRLAFTKSYMVEVSLEASSLLLSKIERMINNYKLNIILLYLQ
jgi:hypothetical protein